MKASWILIGVMAFFQVSADWLPVQRTDAVTLYLDEGTIAKVGGRVRRAWILFDYGQPERVYRKIYQSSKEFLELDCETSRYQILKFILYPESMGQGGVLDISGAKGVWHALDEGNPRIPLKGRLCGE